MSNLGCESVSDLIAEVERLRKDCKWWESIARDYAKILNSTNLPQEAEE